ncbi:hypothetical protein ACWD11_31555 [Streptomyces sp. NPDC002776]
MQGRNDLAQRFPRYSTVQCTVMARRPYGLIVEVSGGFRGYVDLGYISRVPVPEDAWPRVGERRRALVLGVTHDERLRLDLRDDDLDLADRAVNLTEAMRRWTQARHAEPGDEAARQRFYESEDAALILAWLVKAKGRGTPMESVNALIKGAPEGVRRQIVATVTHDALSGNSDTASIISPLYRTCGLALSVTVLSDLLVEHPPSAESLTAFAHAITERPVIDCLKSWAMTSQDPGIQKVGRGLFTTPE